MPDPSSVRIDGPAHRQFAAKRTLLGLGAVFAAALALDYLVLSVASAPLAGESDEEFQGSMRRIVSIAENLLDPVTSQVRAGQLAVEAGRAQAIGLLRTLTYEDLRGMNYVFMFTYDGTLLVQPFDPASEGASRRNYLDAKGVNVVQGLISAAKSGPNGGFFSYWYTPPGEDRPLEKLSFVKDIPELEICIGTGMYLQEIAQKRSARFLWAIFGSLALIAACAGAAMRIILRFGRSILGAESARREAESAAEQAHRRIANLEELFNLMEESILLFDSDGLLINANSVALRFLGIERQGLRTLSFRSLFGSGSDFAEADRLLARVLEGDSLHLERSLTLPSGTETESDITIKRGEWGGRTGLLAEIREMGEQRRMERALYARKEELERFERLVVGRELRMIELKKRVSELESKLEDLRWKEGGLHG